MRKSFEPREAEIDDVLPVIEDRQVSDRIDHSSVRLSRDSQRRSEQSGGSQIRTGTVVRPADE